MKNIYYEATQIIYKNLTSRPSEVELRETWYHTLESLGASFSSIKKGCPLGAKLGLMGYKVTTNKNAQYAITAKEILEVEKPIGNVDEIELWQKVLAKLNLGRFKSYNQQMKVVLAMWEYDKFENLNYYVIRGRENHEQNQAW